MEGSWKIGRWCEGREGWAMSGGRMIVECGGWKREMEEGGGEMRE